MKAWCFLPYALLLIAVDSYAADDCNISLNGSNVTEARLSVGDSIVLECNCQSDWKQNEDYIINDSHHYITSGSTLNILAVRSTDSDTYVESVFIRNPLLCVNELALLECVVTLNTVIGSHLSVLNITWFYNGTYIPTNNITRNDEEYLYISTLQLLSVNDANSGEYACAANVIESERIIVGYTTANVRAKPVVHIMTESLFLYPGDDAVINCSSSVGSYTIIGPNLISSNQPVTINSFSYENESDYNCSSSNVCGENFELLTIQMLVPNVTISGNYTSLRVGSSTDIECETVPSIPNAVIKWQDVSSFNSYSYENVLTIDPVLLSNDNKTFTCVVSSDLISRNLMESIIITIIDTGVSSVSIKFNSSYIIGEQVLLQCSINLTNAIGPNISSLNIKWFKSEEVIRDYIMHDLALPSSVFHSSLTIPSVSFNDAGVYNCTASLTGSQSDEPTTDSMALCLKVLYDDNPDTVTNLALGYSAAIDCVNISSLAEITIKWRDESGNIITSNNTLVFPSVLPSLNDTMYSCTAEVNTNPDSCPHSENKTVKVTVKETYIERVDIVSHESFLISSTVNIECTIILNTPVGPGIQPNVTWYYDATDITLSGSLLRNNDIVFISTLTIDSIQVSDAGVYHCNAGIDSNVTTSNISVCVTVNETLPSVTEELSLGQYYSIDCITGTVPTGVSPSDAGEYQCRASIDGNDTIISNLTNLCVQVPGSVITIDDSYTDLTIGNISEYDCASGYRQSGVIIQWRSPTGTLLTNPLMLTVNQSVTYTCIIRVEANNCQNSLTKNVTFEIRDTLQQLKCNSTTNTDIDINGTDISSIVQISWYKYNGRSIESIKISASSSGVSISSTVPINNTLFQSTLIFSPITSSTPDSTLGNYTCIAWIVDESGRNETSNDVQVLMKINNSRDLVSFNQLHSLYTAGDDLVINCTITPYEMSPSLSTFATIELIHNKASVVESIITSNEYTNITISKDFNGVKLSDAGTYTCQYYLKYSNFTFVLPSEMKTDDIDLFVMIPNNNSPLISLFPDEQYYDVGSNVTLTCSVNYPPPDSHIDVSTSLNISLFLGDDTLIRQSFTNIITYELNNLQLRDATLYTCSYFISSDNDSSFILNSESTNKSIELVVRKIEVNINSSHVVLLDYPPYNNASITCSLMYEPLNQFTDNELQNWFYQTNSTNVTLSLDEQTNQIFQKEVRYTRPGISLYECGVMLLIEGKESNYSNSINITVKGPGLPNKPINMTSVVLNTTSVRIEWVVTSVTYSPEIYTVHYESLSCYHNGSFSINGSTSVEVFTQESNTPYSLTIDGLKPGIKYTYYIASKNTEGHVNTTNGTFTLLETTPDGVPLKFETYNITAYEMTFTWLPPLECFRNGDIIKYSLSCSFNNATHSDIQQSLQHQITSKRENRFTLHNLYPFTNYTCHLAAANGIGEGPAASLNVTTLEASPESEPENLTIISTSSSSLVLTWSKPIQPNGIIVKYTINCSSGIFDNETIDNIVVLNGLVPYTNYTCSVSAHTRIGVGPAAIVTGQTDESTPEAISSSSIAFNDTLILFNWMKPLVTNGQILYYQINLTVSSTTVKTLQSNGSNYITIESDPFVPYQLSIAGYTSKGRGELWVSSVFFSKEGIPPNGPENVTAVWINSTTVKVTWLPLTLAEARGFITRYSVYAGNTGIANVSNDSSIAYIDSLNPMLQYSISVSASTKVGESSNNSVILLPAYVVGTSSNWLPLVIGAGGGGCAVAICICCTIIVCFCCRRRSRRKNPTKTEEAVELYSYITKITTDSVDNDYHYIAAPLVCQNEAAIVAQELRG
uniref:Protein-tyrosine-phosphatase n=1 Tax=Amphimedon queenslandica TaxID=400682 RepID=A0A1X7V2V0_AMPQE